MPTERVIISDGSRDDVRDGNCGENGLKGLVLTKIKYIKYQNIMLILDIRLS